MLEPFKGKLPDGVRRGLEVSRQRRLGPGSPAAAESAELFNAAGWTVKDGKRVNAKGEPLTVEFLAFERVSEPHHALYIKNLTALGVEATLRVVDPVQYRARMQEFDFDISMNRISLSPRRATRCAPTSPARPPTARARRTSAGIANPVVDALIDKAIAANARQDLVLRLPGARSRAARRALLGRRLVQAVALDRLLGHLRPPARPSRTTRAAFRKPGGTTPAKAAKLSG